LVVDGKRQAQ